MDYSNGLDENCLLLLNFENGIDDNFHNIKASQMEGTSFINNSQEQHKFGGFSLDARRANGALAYKIPNVELLMGDYTIDWWEYCTANTNVNGFIYICGVQGLDPNGTIVHCLNNTAIGFYVGNGSSWVVSGFNTGMTRKYSKWSHKAIVRKDGIVKFYEDGVFKAQTAAPDFLTQGNTYIWLSGRPSALTQYWGAFVDEFRVSNIARWTEDFVPPEKPYGPDYPKWTGIQSIEAPSRILPNNEIEYRINIGKYFLGSKRIPYRIKFSYLNDSYENGEILYENAEDNFIEEDVIISLKITPLPRTEKVNFVIEDFHKATYIIPDIKSQIQGGMI